MPLVDLKLVTINYQLHQHENESAQTIVLINGLADDLTTWDAQVPAFLKAGYSVLRYDNRGIGRSSAPAGPYTAQLLADDLYYLLIHTNIRKFHLLGISMGGMIAQTFAQTYPNGSNSMEMLSLSLCCTYAEPTTFCSRMFDLWADMAVRMSIQDVMRDVLLWCFTVPFFRTRAAELAEVDQAMAQLNMSKEAYLAQLNVIRVFDNTESLKALQSKQIPLGNLCSGQVLVLAGEEDILIPVQLSRELHGMLVDARFVTTRGGHGCALEFADDFNNTVLSFLEQVR